MIKEQAFSIEGMDCADCASNIAKAVSGIKGVASAEVLLSTSTLTVTPANGRLPEDEIIKAVKLLGYKIEPDNSAASVSLYVEGLDCADETALIRQKFKSLAGIVDFEVNLATQKLGVTYDSSRISSQDIIRAVAATGMKARLVRPEIKTRNWWRDFRVKLIAASGVLLLMAFILERLGLAQNFTRLIYAASMTAGGYYPLKMALAGLRSRTINIYTLLVIAAIGALLLGYWDEAAVLVFVYTWGAVMETYATEKARGSLRLLMQLAPREALVKREGQELTVPVEEVALGETVIIRPGEKVPLDGVVTAGSSSLDQSPITGESIPMSRSTGEAVFAGSINQRGSLEIAVSKLSGDTTLARIIHSVERSEAKKSSYQQFAERFGRIYTPSMFVLAMLVAFVPWLLGQPVAPWFYRALVMLVVSCSCGLVLSVPISVLASVSAAARKGVLIKGGADLEAASRVEAVVFDKTGTLTLGLPEVTDIVALSGSRLELLGLAASVESRSEHPLGEAVLRRARQENANIKALSDFEALPGLGARGSINGEDFFVGNRSLCQRLSIPLGNAEQELNRLEEEGKTVLLVAERNRALGLIAVEDRVRPEAREAVTELRKAGIKHIVMLTGDNQRTARRIASEAGIDEYRWELLPEDKVAAVAELKSRYHRVAMVGDGVNDAPAMAAADVGIAMGAAGTDIALESADMALMSDDLSRIPYALKVSRKAIGAIRQNVAASLLIVAMVVSLALAGKINLVTGLFINEGSALIVMLNGLRLLKS